MTNAASAGISGTACVITGKGAVELRPVDSGRTLAPTELRIRTQYSLISPGTELAIYSGEHVGLDDPANLFAKYPFTAGYAAVGEVLETGDAITEMRRGDAVYFEGAHASVSTIDAAVKIVRPLPAAADARLCCFARLAQISWTSLHVLGHVPGHVPGDGLGQVSRGSTVAVIGLGLVGNLAAQLFQAEGHEVIATDRLDARRAWARSCRLRGVVEPGGMAPGADIAIEATGAPGVVQTCLDLVRDGGKVVLLGSPRGRAEIDVYNAIHRNGVHLLGAHERLLRADRTRLLAVVDDVLQRIAGGGIVVEPMLTRIAWPSEIADCYRALQESKETTLGVLIDWE